MRIPWYGTMQIFSLLSAAFGCVMYGLLTTVAIMGLLYAALRCLSEDIVKGLPFLGVGVLLFFFLNFQLSLMYGAFEAWSCVGQLALFVTQVIDEESVRGVVDADDAQAVMESIGRQFPVLGICLDGMAVPHVDAAELSSSLVASARRSVTLYICRRALWSLGFIAVAVLAAMLFERKRGGHKRRGREYCLSSRCSQPDDF